MFIKIVKVMSGKSDKIFLSLKAFGLDKDEARIYVHLLSAKEESALDISRALNVSRTKVYAILDKLIGLGLVSTTGKQNAARFYSNSYKQLELLVNKKRNELEMLEGSLPKVFEELASVEISKAASSQIMHYQGIEGLKTVTWNSTKATGILRVFEMAQDLSAFLDFDFSERVRMEFARNKLKCSRQITNFKHISAWTNIEEFVDIWECRYIDPKELKLSLEIVIYNDTVAMYQFKKSELFCIEIYNKDLAEMEKNLFDYVWAKSRPMKVLDKRGSAKVN